jgi:capsular polysaccharide transport system permease protein
MLEILTAFIVCIIFYSFLALLRIDFFPQSPDIAVAAVFASIYFGIGFGWFSAVLVAVFGYMSLNVTIMLMVFLYFLSGVYLSPAAMSGDLLYYNYYNPLYNLVQWYRSAYYAAYDGDISGKVSVLATSTVFLFLGLLGERYLRGKFQR